MSREEFEAERNEFEAAVLAELAEVNGDITEEELNMVIMENIIEDRINELLKNRENLVKERLYSTIDTEKTEENGAYVYNAHGELGLVFDKYDTIADAVRNAVNMINAKVICNGEVITYDTIDSNTAFYVDNRENKVMIVNL